MISDAVADHYKIIAKHYPNMNITQLGLVVLMLGAIRSSMGHEGAKGTLVSYINKDMLSEEVKECIEFLEREILRVKKSRIDIDFWKFGNTGQFRDN